MKDGLSTVFLMFAELLLLYHPFAIAASLAEIAR
jgi:hypothetical protein